jgi:glutamate--cysteine ligase
MSPLTSQQRGTLITANEQLLDYLRAGAKPSEQWGIGAEMEKLVLDGQTGEAADYGRIEALLVALQASGDWRPIQEGDHLVGLQGSHSSVTLEPGGQLELSGKLCRDLFCNHVDFARHVSEVVRIGEGLGLIFLGLGTQPFTALDQINWLPKARYNIMGKYMLRTGDMGQRMMKQSAGLQVNLDFSDEADCFAKLRLAQALAPLLYALFANSPLLEGKPSGYLSTRGEIWSRTDPDRSGLLPFLFEPGAGFQEYVDYALDVPMYFIERNGQLLDLTTQRFTFRDYLDQGHLGHSAIMADWELHLSTLFPEVRLRPQIEVRSADSLPPHLALSVAALLKGLLYDSDARSMAWELCRPESCSSLRQLCQQAWHSGLKTPWRNGTLQTLAKECLGLARTGLKRHHQQCAEGLSECGFLQDLEELIDSGETLAERLLKNWPDDRAQQVKTLREHCGFPGRLSLTP